MIVNIDFSMRASLQPALWLWLNRQSQEDVSLLAARTSQMNQDIHSVVH
jgi:hypothetical protein